jgi:signal transduction histidine kinase
MLHHDSPLALLVLSDRFLARRVPPPADAEAIVSSITADGHFIVGAREKESSALHAMRTFRAGDLTWAVQVEPTDGRAFYMQFVRQFDIYLATIVLVMALFVSGGFVIARGVRREVEVARLKADFVSTVSHEFRSPLTGITQLAEMLVRDRVRDERKRREYYGLMLREAERLGRLVETVLDFARMEDGRKQYRFEPLDAVAWLKSVATEFAEEASRTGYSLEAAIAENLPMLSGDREALSTAVRNLLHNAVKYSPQSKTVWLDADAVGDRVRIAVRDRGVGIALRHQQRIFEKFYRVDGDLAARVKGVGLGLSLVRHIVDSHHGTVTVDSREGEGSTFAIELTSAT